MSRDLEEEARKAGYADLQERLYQLYEEQKLSLSECAAVLHTASSTCARLLVENGITVRSRGGPNHQLFEVTEQLIEEVEREGVRQVAARLNVVYSTLYNRLSRLGKLPGKKS